MSDPYAPPPADHRVKITHLVFGLLFLGAAGTWALGASAVIDGEHLVVLAPLLLVGAGVIGLVASLASGRNARRRRSAEAGRGYDHTEYAGVTATDTATDTATATEIDDTPTYDTATDLTPDDTEPTAPITRTTDRGTDDDHTEEIR